MDKKLFAFTINTLEQAEIIISETKNYNIKPTLHFKNYIIKGFGSDFILNFQKVLISKFGLLSFKIFIDCGFNNALGISMATKKIEFIKVRGNKFTL